MLFRSVVKVLLIRKCCVVSVRKKPASTAKLEGEHKVAEDGFTEFYPTEASIQKAVLTLFWEPVEE